MENNQEVEKRTILEELRKTERLRVNRIVEEKELPFWREEIENTKPEELSEVPEIGTGYRLIYRLRNKERYPLLRKEAIDTLELIDKRWQEQYGDKILLSVTSLYRTKEEQKRLIEEGKIAADISTHQAGAAIDFDPNGYYYKKNGEIKPISSKDISFYSDFPQKLLEILLELEKEGFCNVIVEKNYREKDGKIEEYTSCYHVCALKKK
ncbi:MAG: hypothetical protein KatS3mg088_351 [Patescibacteria group bacterium]|nr:MAG: hypothetical protein KatS3mg088_351 [Patescibacteria group bacterium]